MKPLNKYLVNKHINKSDIKGENYIKIKSENDLVLGCYWACEYITFMGRKHVYFGKLSDTQMVSTINKNFYQHYIYVDVDNEYVGYDTYGMCVDLSSNQWRTPTDDELKLIHEIEEWVEESKPKSNTEIGQIKNNKFIPK